MGKFSDFLALSINISKAVADTAKSYLLLVTNRKSHVSFRLTPRSMTSNAAVRSNFVGISPDFAILGGNNG